jgi:hypothetical protein
MRKKNRQGWGRDRSMYGALRTICIAVGVWVAFSTGAAAQTPVIYSVAGVQIGVTETSSTFAGVAFSNDGDFARWDALVLRTPLNPDPREPVAGLINGGTFQLNGQVRNVLGNFVDGVILRESTSCRRETFSVTGTLALDDGGTGGFDLTLTHYRLRLGSQCITYFATVEGLVQFTTP